MSGDTVQETAAIGVAADTASENIVIAHRLLRACCGIANDSEANLIARAQAHALTALAASQLAVVLVTTMVAKAQVEQP